MEKKMSYYELDEKVREYYNGDSKRIKDSVHMSLALGDWLNGHSRDDENDFLQCMTTHEHRTIQQMYFGLVLRSIKAFAEIENYDGRNEYSVKTAQKLLKFMEENGIGVGTPLI